MDHFSSIIGQSPALDSLLRSARIVSSTDVTLLLKGETGTGKEVLATAIQKAGTRANKPFISLNCAALAESLIESELFGHKRGSFTGANADKQGLFQAADGGTLFLDEINSLPLSVQGKLLRFLESGECLAVGGIKPYKVDIRIISATNTDLDKQIKTGEFRSDLYFRLNVVPLELPNLSQRTEDIEALIKHFLGLFENIHALAAPKFSKSTIKVLKAYPWPGNIRELRNLCERLSILLAGKIIEPENLPLEFTYKSSGNRPLTTDFILPVSDSRSSNPELLVDRRAETPFTLPEKGVNLDMIEVNFINQALTRTKGNRSKSARLLGISRDTLLYRMQKHGLELAH